MARSFTDSRRGEMNAKNGEEHGRKSGIQTHTTHTPVALVGPIHQLNKIHKKETQMVEFLDGKIAKQGTEIQEQRDCKGIEMQSKRSRMQ